MLNPLGYVHLVSYDYIFVIICCPILSPLAGCVLPTEGSWFINRFHLDVSKCSSIQQHVHNPYRLFGLRCNSDSRRLNLNVYCDFAQEFHRQVKYMKFLVNKFAFMHIHQKRSVFRCVLAYLVKLLFGFFLCTLLSF